MLLVRDSRGSCHHWLSLFRQRGDGLILRSGRGDVGMGKEYRCRWTCRVWIYFWWWWRPRNGVTIVFIVLCFFDILHYMSCSKFITIREDRCQHCLRNGPAQRILQDIQLSCQDGYFRTKVFGFCFCFGTCTLSHQSIRCPSSHHKEKGVEVLKAKIDNKPTSLQLL